MEWQQLEYFHVVARLQHFTRAAETLSVSQSALSRSIARLENELGVKLFERKGRGIELNRYGRLFYAKTSLSLQQLEQAKQEVADLLDQDHGTISFAFLKSLGASFVPQLLGDFLGQYPRVQFELFQNATNAMLDQLEAGDIDFCLSTITETRPAVEWQHLWTDRLYAFVPAAHALAGRETVSPRELAAHRLIALKPGYGTRAIMDQLFARAGSAPQLMFEGEEIVTLVGFVRAGLGVAVLPPLQGVDLEGVVRLPIDDPACIRTIGLAWNADGYLSPVAKRFKAFLQRYALDHFHPI